MCFISRQEYSKLPSAQRAAPQTMGRARLALGLLLGVAARSKMLGHSRRGAGWCTSSVRCTWRSSFCGSSVYRGRPLASASSEEVEPLPGVLYLVPVPIGNVEDITLRALKILRSVDLIACEDTRSAGLLLKRLGISRTPDPSNPKVLRPDLLSCYEQVEKRRVEEVVGNLAAMRKVAMITDAGTPAISDPGHHIVSACVNAGIEVVSLPGPCAAVVALAASGFVPGPALLYGFIPQKRGSNREAAIQKIAWMDCIVVLYEAPHRLRYTLEDLVAAGIGDRPILVGRELTKRHEQIFRGVVQEALDACRDSVAEAQARASSTGTEQIPLKGEFTVVLGPLLNPKGRIERSAEATSENLRTRIELELRSENPPPPSQLSKLLSKEFGLPRNAVYNQILGLADDKANKRTSTEDDNDTHKYHENKPV